MKILGNIKRALRRKRLANRDPAEIFSHYFRINKWGDKDSLSGKGSNLSATAEVRRLLPRLLQDLQATTLLDVPCGDFFWMKHVDLTGIDYLGGDIVPELIQTNLRNHARPGVRFQVVDLIRGPVPKADVIFVRDCLVHLSHEHARAALANIAVSGGTWLLTTTFPGSSSNEDIATGEWRAIDLELPPFNLPPPVQLFAEGQAHLKGQRPDKMLGLWKISDLAEGRL